MRSGIRVASVATMREGKAVEDWKLVLTTALEPLPSDQAADASHRAHFGNPPVV